MLAGVDAAQCSRADVGNQHLKLRYRFYRIFWFPSLLLNIFWKIVVK